MKAKEVRDKFIELEERIQMLERENGSPTEITLEKLTARIGELELKVQMLEKPKQSWWSKLKFW